MRAAVFTKPYSLTPVLPDSGQSGLPVNKLHTRKGYSGNVALKLSRGYLSHIHRVKSPGVAEQPESVCIQRMRPERGRAVLLGVCLQNCQLRSPGQKSFYLLKQMLSRTKCQADFKARRCAEPRLPLLGSDCSPACCSPNPLLRYRLPFLPMHPTAFEDLLMRSLFAC